MLKPVLTASALGLAALIFSALETPASALPRLDVPRAEMGATAVRWHGHHGFHRFHHVGSFHHFRHHRHGRFFIGAPVVYGYGGGCGWLRHRALVTDSPYWWHRYRLCRYGW